MNQLKDLSKAASELIKNAKQLKTTKPRTEKMENSTKILNFIKRSRNVTKKLYTFLQEPHFRNWIRTGLITGTSQQH